MSPADIALHLWLADSDWVCRKHAERQSERRKSFRTYRAVSPVSTAWTPKPAEVTRLTKGVDDWYAERKRGRGTRIQWHEHNDEVRFIVGRGGLYRREASLNEGREGTVHFRPHESDVLILNRRSGELRVNADGRPAADMYKVQVGLFLFGHRDYFPGGEARYTFEPIRRLGRGCLVCGDVPGIERVLLKSVDLDMGGGFHRLRTERGDDVFAMLEAEGDDVLSRAEINSALFELKFTNSKRPRTAVIRRGNEAKYGRGDDAAIIERWLELRGFCFPAPPFPR